MKSKVQGPKSEVHGPRPDAGRSGGRAFDALRAIRMERGWTKHPAGSVLISWGNTRVLCTASVSEEVPAWLAGKGRGWVTAEYGMLPGSTHERRAREGAKGRPDGRTLEIQRLIGRSLRAVTDLRALGERTVWLDCDVLQADGGTRTASITGAYVALHDALARLRRERRIRRSPLRAAVAAASVGVLAGRPLLDLEYVEDSAAEVDMNVVMTSEGRFVEIQGTAEKGSFDDAALGDLLSLAKTGIRRLLALQEAALRTPLGR